MADTFVSRIAGQDHIKTPITASTGVANANQIPATNASGVLDSSFMPPNTGAPTVTAVASEAIAAGAHINLYDDAGTTKMRNADSTNGTKKAHGFVLTAAASGSSGTAYQSGDNTALTGLTVGTKYFLGTAGAATATPPTANGNSVQLLGIAYSTSALYFQQHDNTLIG